MEESEETRQIRQHLHEIGSVLAYLEGAKEEVVALKKAGTDLASIDRMGKYLTAASEKLLGLRQQLKNKIDQAV